MKLLLVSALLIASFTQAPSAQASVRLELKTLKHINPKTKKVRTEPVVRVYSKIYFYGGSATEELAQKSAAEIQRMWNEFATVVKVDKKDRRVVFNIKYQVVTEAAATEIAAINKDLAVNFVRMEPNNSLNVSFWAGLGSNSGFFALKDNLGVSTTTAHEFGHGMGLDHPFITNIRGEGQPGIMYPRGTWVDNEFQWDPKAQPGQKGGTLNPNKRKVLQKDVLSLEIERAQFDSLGVAAIGHLNNKILPANSKSNREWIE